MVLSSCSLRASSSRFWISQALLGLGGRQNQTIYPLSSRQLCRRHFRSSTNLLLSSAQGNGNAPTDVLHIHPKVSSALQNGEAVVALESTIVTHGMPQPENLRTALKAEEMILSEGAVPATVAAIDGKLCVGLTKDQLEILASTQEAFKTSRRDLAWVLSQKAIGGTTVSGTMVGAHMAGIPIFVTGGIGGVHRGGETTMDVSADLTELGRTPITVVSAGIKSILDIPRTLEYLETQGVTVAVYGSSREFPAFFTGHSGVKASINLRTPKEAAELINSNQSLGLGSGILIAVPIPENYEAEGEAIETAIQNALAEASQQSISGKDVTPFILQRVNELTAGKSLEANKALYFNNVIIGSQIAGELAALKRRKRVHIRESAPGDVKRNRKRGPLPMGRPVVIGSSIVDHSAIAAVADLVYGGTTNIGKFHVSYGGVGRNLADALARLGADPIFLSAVGNDHAGNALQSNCSHMDFSKVLQSNDARTAAYCLVIGQKGDVELGIGDMEINNLITPEYISQHTKLLEQAPLVCMDGNIPVEAAEYIASFCDEHHIPLWFEPTCVMKSTVVCQAGAAYKKLAYASPNVNELRKMYEAVTGEEVVKFRDDLPLKEKLEECIKLSSVLMRYVYCLVITLSEDGLLVCCHGNTDDPWMPKRKDLEVPHLSMFSAYHYPACPVDDHEGGIVSVSGAGDCLAAAMMVGMLRGYPQHDCVLWGLEAAGHSLRSHQAVPGSITEKLLASPPFSSEEDKPRPTKLQ